MTDLKAALDYPQDDVRRFKEAGLWTDTMPHQVLAEWARTAPNAPALIGPKASFTYAEFCERSQRFASGLLSLGLRRGDVIGLQLPNIPEFLIAYFGAQMMGAVPCMFHMPYRSGELESLIAHVRPRAIICVAASEKYDAPALMQKLQERSPTLETVIVVGGRTPPGCLAFDDLSSTGIGEISDQPGPDDPAIILFTSGTSTQPKAVVHAHRTLTASAFHTGDRMGITSQDVVLCAPAHTHAFGLCMAVTIMLAGAANALLPEYSPPLLSETIQRTKPTIVLCGLAHIQAGLKAKLWGPEIAGSVRRVITGGAPCPPEVLRSLEAALSSGKVFQVWGMTEVWMPIFHDLNAPLDLRAASLGSPPVGHQVRVVARDGTVLGPGDEGELQMRGPFLMASYYRNDSATRDAFTDDGWFRTGDMATIDANGFIAITGRLKDIINRGGIKINPMDIEVLMDAHPAVQISAVVPMPDEILGERACLFVQTVPGRTLTLENVCDYLAANNMAKLRWPERLEIVEAMPMTATRKIVKRKLVELLKQTGTTPEARN
ncbi:MAG: acyl--CoA ligase [Pseudorhodoplanes sp.]|nr:MAG: acyl--CoA ligase [Pseudorhodoplanes sp.]